MTHSMSQASDIQQQKYEFQFSLALIVIQGNNGVGRSCTQVILIESLLTECY